MSALFAVILSTMEDRTANDMASGIHPEPQASDGEGATGFESQSSPIELMVNTRARRSNAGNRMSKLISMEEVDDIGRSLYEALEDVPDDDDFSGSEAEMEADDISLVSSASDNFSSDEHDSAQDEDFNGEKELQKEERIAQRVSKRKAHDAFLKRPGLLKRARLRDTSVRGKASAELVDSKLVESPTVSTEQTQRKRSDRVLQLGTDSYVRGQSRRLSSRASALKARAETHERLVSKERVRLITVATMKAAEERREALKRKPLTQEDRLAEAARTERLNAKSLNRWEEAERKKIAERRAKLEAQRNKGIEGEFIRYWSGSVGDRMSDSHARELFSGPEHSSAFYKKSSGKSQNSVSSPLSTTLPNAVSEANIPIGLDGSGSRVATESNAAESADDTIVTSQLPPALTRENQAQNLHPTSTSTTQTPALPMSTSHIILPLSSPESQLANGKRSQSDLYAVENFSSLLDGIHFWASQPEVKRQAETSAAGAHSSPILQTVSTSDATICNSTALKIVSAKVNLPRNENSGASALQIPVQTSALQTDPSSLKPPSFHPQQSLSSLRSPSPDNKAEKCELPSQRLPRVSSRSQQSDVEKRTRNLIMLQNIDPSQAQNINARDRDREKDFLRRKLFGWPTVSSACTGLGSLTTSLRSMNSSYTRLSIQLANEASWIHFL